MFISAARAYAALRASLLVLLVLGVMIRPVLNQVGDLHAAGHATFVAGDHGHDHSDDDHDPDTYPDHTKGAHGLMHQADTGTSAGIWVSWALPPALLLTSVLPMPDSASVHPQQPSSPFRPPIA